MSNDLFIKSPLNYIGGKYKMLPQLMQYFPKNIDTFVDLFAGGCDVCCNINANHIYANDINSYIISIYQSMQKYEIDDILNEIDNTIQKEGLSKTNKNTYLSFRKKYNNSETKNPIDLYILLCFCFNHQCRFNNSHLFNSPFGKDRSCFTKNMRKNLIDFHKSITDKNINFSSFEFKSFNYDILKEGDFLYADPPYLISTGSYNDGNRGFKDWSEDDDKELCKILDKLNNRGIRFALSNVIQHKGLTNDNLIKWSSKYNVHYINYDYNNSSYHGKNTDKETIEVLITNY